MIRSIWRCKKIRERERERIILVHAIFQMVHSSYIILLRFKPHNIEKWRTSENKRKQKNRKKLFLFLMVRYIYIFSLFLFFYFFQSVFSYLFAHFILFYTCDIYVYKIYVILCNKQPNEIALSRMILKETLKLKMKWKICVIKEKGIEWRKFLCNAQGNNNNNNNMRQQQQYVSCLRDGLW